MNRIVAKTRVRTLIETTLTELVPTVGDHGPPHLAKLTLSIELAPLSREQGMADGLQQCLGSKRDRLAR